MKTALIYLLIIFYYLPSIVRAAAFDDRMDSCLSKIFNYANMHDIKAIEEYEKVIKQTNNHTLNIAYNVALYIASPKKYENIFIDNFPVSSEGLNDLYESIELKNYTPRFLFSFNSIGVIAERGNKKAIYKVINGYINSDGVVSEYYSDFIIELFKSQLKNTLIILSKFDKTDREKVYYCFDDMDYIAFKKLTKKLEFFKNTKGIDKKVLCEIEKYYRDSK